MKTVFASTIALALLVNPALVGTAHAENDSESTATATTKPVAKKGKGNRLGVLDCTVEGGFGLLIGSSRNAACTFTQADGSVERYAGKIGKLGIDIGVSGESFMKWVVVTPLQNVPGDHTLAGTYVGISASGALGIGLGANALVGGSDKNIGLQPVSLEGKTGLNVAAGLTRMTLSPAG